ncbi:hypothetical protein [Ornithinimicrobium cerasi]|uniref:Helix-turn-helix domain-containing protein n=1 Tax=Ornithinimicrobium cerasi TaxID=2248773 RepID=A0A285VRY7_9MICO|nr:hypothetical protein [Ornithinimicrobium cerasi]SOC56854.1 hypothetical protein SAMN05421879_10963 [Ornithinimicrobium cerasi]
MKTSRATVIGVSVLTAAVVGLGASAPSLADNLGLVTSTEDSPTTDDGSTDDGSTDDTTDERFGPRGHHGMGDGRHGGMGGMGGMGGGMGAPADGHGMIGTAAETLGLTEDELLTELRDGRTLGEVADAQGVDRQALVDALLADHEARLTEMLDETHPGPGQMRWQDDDGAEDGSTTTSGT